MNLTRLFDQVSKIKVRSITDSLFKFSAVLFVIGCISNIFATDTWPSIVLFVLGGICTLTALIFYCYFSLKSPDYLRSEDFHIKKQSIEMLGDKNNQLNPNVKEVVYISSPYSKKNGDDEIENII